MAGGVTFVAADFGFLNTCVVFGSVELIFTEVHRSRNDAICCHYGIIPTSD